MIKLFVLDIDGCLTYPFLTPDWETISRIRELQSRSREEEHVPELSICTGRPLPYAEAVAQWLDIRKPLIFESGGGLFDPEKYQLEWSGHYLQNRQDRISEIRKWVENEIIPDYDSSIMEFSKRWDVGLVSNVEEHITEIYDRVKLHIKKNFPGFVVHRTDISVNIISEKSNKGSGLIQLAEYTGIPLKKMAFIGDSSGDIAALEISGMAFAPANATEEVKKMGDVIHLTQNATKAVLEGYEMLIKRNEKILSLNHR